MNLSEIHATLKQLQPVTTREMTQATGVDGEKVRNILNSFLRWGCAKRELRPIPKRGGPVAYWWATDTPLPGSEAIAAQQEAQ